MKALCSVLVLVGMLLALGGVMAVFNFDQPSDMFSMAWWMIVGGWFLALTGMGIDILRLLTLTKDRSAYAFQSKTMRGQRGEREISRI